VALVFSCIAAFAGMAVIAWYVPPHPGRSASPRRRCFSPGPARFRVWQLTCLTQVWDGTFECSGNGAKQQVCGQRRR
jgi:hypothetical protein